MTTFSREYDNDKIISGLAFHGKVHLQNVSGAEVQNIEVNRLPGNRASFTVTFVTDAVDEVAFERIMSQAAEPLLKPDPYRAN